MKDNPMLLISGVHAAPQPLVTDAIDPYLQETVALARAHPKVLAIITCRSLSTCAVLHAMLMAERKPVVVEAGVPRSLIDALAKFKAREVDTLIGTHDTMSRGWRVYERECIMASTSVMSPDDAAQFLNRVLPDLECRDNQPLIRNIYISV